MRDKEISQAVIGRLPRYYRYLKDLMDQGRTRISSGELSEIMKVTASQIRQDLNNFGGFGQQGYGYNVESLYGEIGKILGMDRMHRMVLCGAGNLGQALINYTVFAARGFRFECAFDTDEKLVGKKIADIPVYHASEIESYLSEHETDIVVLTLPRAAAQETASKVCACGIKAIWNFAQTDLEVPEGVSVENVHLQDSLMKLSYKLTRS